MKRNPDSPVTSGMPVDRRGFLAGVTASLGSLPLQSLAAASGDKGPTQRGQLSPHRAVYQGLAYIDHDGLGDTWDKPPGNQATRDYINSISQETFLRRHWFT